MLIIKRSLIVLVAIILSLSACSFSSSEQSAKKFKPLDFRDIPGITTEEIDAIEKVKADRDVLYYGMSKSVEAFSMIDTGEKSGFAVLFAKDLSQIFGIDFDLQIYDWGNLYSKFKEGKVDFTSELSVTAERTTFIKMSEPVADRVMCIFTKADASSLDEIKNDRKLRYGFLEDTTMYDWVRDAEGDTFDAVFVETDKELQDMLESGEIDAFFEENISSIVFDSASFIVSNDYFPQYHSPVSLATTKSELEPFLSALDKYIKAGYKERLTDLYAQGYDMSRRHMFFSLLNDEEKAYMQKHLVKNETIPVILEAENYPSSFWNNHDNEFQGVAVDILEQITEMSGLSFENIGKRNNVWAENLKDLEMGKAAMVTDLSFTESRVGRFLWAEEPYSTDYYTMVSLEEAPYASMVSIPNARVGTKEGTAIVDLYHNWFPKNENLKTYPNYIDALDALGRGELDFVMMSRNSLLSMTNFLERPGYKANIVFDHVNPVQFGFNKDEVILSSIISKAQSQIDTKRISDSWNRKTFDYTRSQMQYLKYLFILLAIVFVLLLVLFITKIRINKRLEKTVKVRTHELSVQTKVAEVESQAKSDFLARMSHEIRTPLNAIIGMNEITRRAAGDKEKVIYGTGEISLASSHLLAIINDILDMSKIESGKFQLNEEPFHLTSALDEIYSIMYQKFINSKIKFIVDFGEFDDICVVGDRLRIKQVLINLLGNAVKFTPPEGSVTFYVQPVSKNDESISIDFKIIDTGIGMTKEQSEKLFTAFEQADKSISTRFGGTGLGLAISQSLINLMGGNISITSEIGKGSTFFFTITLPFGESALGSDLNEDTIPNLEGKRILLAEDVEINRVILNELLADTKALIDEAEDGQMAVDMVSDSPEYYYDLIFMDIQMPKLNGYEATEHIRALEREDVKRVPIIAMTANAYREDIEKALASGMNGHIAKPLDINIIMHTLTDKIGP